MQSENEVKEKFCNRLQLQIYYNYKKNKHLGINLIKQGWDTDTENYETPLEKKT